MEEWNNTPIPAPFPLETPLDPKDVARIQRLSVQQIEQMEARHIARLTHDFDERYARMIVEKGNSPAEEKKLLAALRKAFDTMHIQEWDFGEAIYDQKIPAYFGEWDFKIAIDGRISAGEDAQLPSEVNPTSALTLSEMLSEEGMLKDWLDDSTHKLTEQLRGAKEDAEGMLQQIKALHDGSLKRMQKKLENMQSKLTEAEATNRALRGDLDDMIKWRKDWENIKQSVLQAYDPADVAEAGGLSDPEAMEIVVEAIMDGCQSEKKLKEENEQLRETQEKWRESPEYLAEKQKWEKSKQQSIEVAEIKNKMLEYAKTFTDGERLRNFVLNFNGLLEGTAWVTESAGILTEALKTYKEVNPTLSTVGGDYVVNKHVQHEVGSVASGATGISLSKGDQNPIYDEVNQSLIFN